MVFFGVARLDIGRLIYGGILRKDADNQTFFDVFLIQVLKISFYY